RASTSHCCRSYVGDGIMKDQVRETGSIKSCDLTIFPHMDSIAYSWETIEHIADKDHISRFCC
ncbi:hypothetical protein CP061683_0453B, partial [Chlamydia psittaci 06-1683]